MADIEKRAKNIIAEHLGIADAEVRDGAAFIDDLGADSLDIVEIVMNMEDEFGIEIPDDVTEALVTVGDAISYLEANAV